MTLLRQAYLFFETTFSLANESINEAIAKSALWLEVVLGD
jgi:hypothetical protein